MDGQVKHADDTSFEAAVNGEGKVVLVDFWAPWCGPCRAVGPVLEEIAGDYAGRIEVVKVNVDDSPATASRYSVRSIPTLNLMKGGQVVQSRVGMAQKAELTAWIDGHLS